MNPGTDTRERIIASARDLIFARSYAAVGVAEICAEAGVKKGSFYHFFPSKRDLTLAVLDQAFIDLKSDLLDHAFAPDVSPLTRLQRFVDMSCQRQRETFHQTGLVSGCRFGNLAAEQATQDDVLRDKVAKLFRRMEQGLAAILTEAKLCGEVGDIDVDKTAAAMFAYLEGAILMAKTRNDPEVLCALLPTMCDIRVAGESS